MKKIDGNGRNVDLLHTLYLHTVPLIYCIEKEFSTKYASKGEKMSSVARDVFTSILNETSSDSDSSRIIKKLIMKAVGQRDKGIREVMHQLLSINLWVHHSR